MKLRHPAVMLPAICGAVYAGMAWWFLDSGVDAIDDAYISLRYARNLVRGEGLVFNPGEFVQGYTNFLWVMVQALLLKLGLPAIPAGCALGGMAGAAVVALTALWSSRRLAPGLVAAAVAPVLLVSNLGLVMWSMRGLETGLFTLLVLAGALIYLRQPPTAPLSLWMGFLFALAALTRPEGVLILGLTLTHMVGARLLSRRRILQQADFPALALFAGVLAAYAGWAAFYYGDILPNTFHAKVGGTLDSLPRGWEYLKKFGRYGTGLPLLALPLAVLPRRRLDHTRSYALMVLAGMGFYIAAVGGDVFPAYRFLVPVMPFLYLLVGDGVAAVESLLRRRLGEGGGLRREATPRLLVAGLLITMALATFKPSAAFAWREWRGGNRYTADMRMVGVWLREHEAPGTWIAVNPAGALPFESDLPAIDMLGLTDREIARTPVEGLGGGRLAGHEKGNGASVLRRRPAIILIGGVKLDSQPRSREWRPHGRSERELAANPNLYRDYRLEQQPMPDGRILTFLRLREGAGGQQGRQP